MEMNEEGIGGTYVIAGVTVFTYEYVRYVKDEGCFLFTGVDFMGVSELNSIKGFDGTVTVFMNYPDEYRALGDLMFIGGNVSSADQEYFALVINGILETGTRMVSNESMAPTSDMVN